MAPNDLINGDLIDLYAKYLHRKSASPRTITDRCQVLRHADRELAYGLDAALDTEIEDWIWREGLKPASRSAYYTAFTQFYRWAVGHAGVITLDPTIGIVRPKVPRGSPRVAKDEHARHIVTVAPEPYQLWGKLAGYGGLRCIEIQRLHREHMTPTDIHVLKGKGDKAGWVPMHPIIWDAVKDLPAGPITSLTCERALSNSFLVYCRRRHMAGMSLHRLRGWFATMGYRATRDLRAVQQAMRHEDPAVTARYIAVDDRQVAAVIAGLPTFG